MAVDRGKPTLVPTSKPKTQAHWWDQPKAKPAPAPKSKPKPAPRPRVVQPVARPTPVAPPVAARGHAGLDRPAPKTIARSPAHTGAKPKPAPKPMLMASRNPKAQALAILATQTNATPETVAKVRKLAAVANLQHPDRPIRTGAAPAAPVKISDPRVQKLIAGGYLDVADKRQDRPGDFGLAKVLFGPSGTKLVKGPKSLTVKERRAAAAKPQEAQLSGQPFTPAAAKLLKTAGLPGNAVTAGIDAAIKGKNIPEAINLGLAGRTSAGGGKIVRDLGVKSKFLQGTLGLVVDFGTDPLSATTFGAGTVAERAAVKVAERAGKEALAAGATTQEARLAAQAAMRAEVRRAGGAGEKGLTFRVVGKEVPGVRRGTAAVNRGSKKLPGAKKRAQIKEAAREVNPHLTPAGVPIAEHQHVQNAGAAARNQIHDAENAAADIGRGLESLPVHPKYGDKETQYRAIIHAIETHDYESLPSKQLQDKARHADELMMENRNTLVAEGVPVGDITKAQIRIPDITANPAATRKALREAQTRRSVAERANKSQIRKSGVAEGRAQVLVKQSDRKAGAKAASNKPVRTLSKLERQQSKLNPAEQEVQNARQAVKDAQTAHEAEVALHRVQKAERKVATPPYMRAAVKELDAALAERAKAVARQEGPRILKGRTKTDLTKAQEDFPSANLTERAARQDTARTLDKINREQPVSPEDVASLERQGLVIAPEHHTKLTDHAVLTPEGRALLAHAPRPALGPVDFADRKVAAAQAKVDELRGQTAKGFVPHNLTDMLEPARGLFGTESVGSQTIKIGTMNKRQDLRTIAAQNAERPDKLSTNLPLLVANYIASTGTAAAKARFNKALMATGRPVTYSTRQGAHLGEGESLWAINGANIHPVAKGESKIAGAKYVALNTKLAEHHLGNVVPMSKRTHLGEFFDHTTGLWKRSKTFSLAFHARNMIGDTHMAYLVPGRSFRRVAIEGAQATKVLKAARRMDKQRRSLEPITYSGQTIKIGKERVPVEDVVRRLRFSGATDTGYLSRELRDLRGGSTPERVFQKIPGRGRLRRLMEERENIHRIGTALHGIGKKGMTDAEAAALSRYHHIDYGNLSSTEKTALRRIMPFYTFTARGLPIFVKALAKNPAKFAAYEKLIEETAAATGTDRDRAYAKLQTWEAQQAPLIVGGKQAATSSPVNLFNLLPDPTALGKSSHLAFDQLMGLANPIGKTPIEAMSNYSFFTHRKIRDPKGDPYAAAPDWVKALPKAAQKKLGVIDNYIDPRSGKKVLGWDPRSAYWLSQAPALATQASGLATKGTGLRGQNLLQKAIADVTGVKISPVDKPTNQVINDLYNRWNKADNRIRELNHQYYRGKGITADNPTPEYTRLLKQRTDLGKAINAAAIKLGDKTPPFASKAKPDPLADLMKKAGLPAQSGNTKAELDALAKKAGLPAKGAGASKAELDALARKAGLIP